MNRRQILENIPIEKINILNPRERNRKIANEIKKNIEDVGLKRPITVSRRLDFTDGKEYDLVCGQGRLFRMSCVKLTKPDRFAVIN